jgi:uncharacterized UPF0160 family protein
METLKVVTHDKLFHADDVMAVAIFSIIAERTGLKLEIIRTRNEELIRDAHVVVDVGGIYDVSNRRFDHHQKGFDVKRPNGVKYSSAGLVWKSLGISITEGSDEELLSIVDTIDSNIIQYIDAHDNGQSLEELEVLNSNNKSVKNWQLSEFISSFNPTWDEEPNYDSNFILAVRWSKTLLENEIAKTKAKVRAKHILEKSMKDIDNQEYLILERYVPYEADSIPENFKFIIYPDVSDEWRISTIPVKGERFKARKDLPESWAGLRGKELDEAIGLTGSIFCHNGRFIAGHNTRAGILEMVKLALAE